MTHQTVSIQWDTVLTPTVSGRTSAPQSNCPVEVALQAISGRWTTLILRNLEMHGSLSFSALAQSLPVLSDKVLSERLIEMVDQGLVDKQSATGFPIRTTYSLTKRGRELRPLLIELYRTGLALQLQR